MFACKAGAYLNDKWFTRVGSNLTHKHFTKLERLSRDKRSSLLWKVVTYGCKKFYNIGTWFEGYKKLFFFVTQVM